LTLIVIPAVYELVERRKDRVPAAQAAPEAVRGGEALA